MKKIIYLFLLFISIIFTGCATSDAFKYTTSGDLPKLKELIENDKVSINAVGGYNNDGTLFYEAVRTRKFQVAD